MERVLGIGGIFFKSENPDKLKAWYVDNLGVPVDENGYVCFPVKGDPGPYAAWSAFAKDTKYFAPSTASFMVNYRVKDLHAMLAQLRKAGATVDEKFEETEYGKFGWALDPEGNRFELWEPPPEKS
jgi:predicted enzyme related to lactoylglutathione lyase